METINTNNEGCNSEAEILENCQRIPPEKPVTGVFECE